jgi:hypothetical protein
MVRRGGVRGRFLALPDRTWTRCGFGSCAGQAMTETDGIADIRERGPVAHVRVSLLALYPDDAWLEGRASEWNGVLS